MVRGEESVVGLRIDVDTFRGTRDGVPRLLELLAARRIRATFFFSVGPDNMGRHFWRLFKPAFLAKMLRSNAPGLYGWDIVLRGTAWPGPRIAERLGDVIRAARDAGHEVGLHAWDHHRWQARANVMRPAELAEELDKGTSVLRDLLGSPVRCSAAAGWQCNEDVIRAKEPFGFQYNSDCRGSSIFRPVVDGVAYTPQIPVTLPTYDELIGRQGIGDETYNETLLSRMRPGKLNVLAVHAEVEGLSRHQLFCDFLDLAERRGYRFVALDELRYSLEELPLAGIACATFPGREGELCIQAGALTP